ncbi:hypothetical protein TanjilG_08734 [Lupinus angustifolius]|uniref:Retrotransposon Copia-like N-terminal domain-containing protein n=1 Tax=Lupinus angustifolius TaxID=3871 RepID=A0A4P1QQ21_LUPAN|nr:hypothetical protein TanjilG_08734 [Lupinus angustifolius]
MASQDFTDFNSNPSNPYFLSPSENPTMVLVSQSLNGKNYHSWCRAILCTLNGTDATTWFSHSYNIQWSTPLLNPSSGWIMHEVWKDLHDRFSQGDFFRISTLLE